MTQDQMEREISRATVSSSSYLRYASLASVQVAIAICTEPSDATSAVTKSGRSLVSAPSEIVDSRGLPLSRRLRMNDSMTKPFGTATPQSAIKPTVAEIDNGMSRNQSATIPPVSARGMPENTVSPSRSLPNIANSRVNMSSKASSTTI